jgi:serine/threonine protein phosphatase PrpC
MTDHQHTITIRAAGATDVGRRREKNEDAFIVADLTARVHAEPGAAVEYALGPQGVLLAVSDGMGGARAGEVASALVVDAVRDALDAPGTEEHIGVAVRDAAVRANRVVYDTALETDREGMGATLTAVLVHGPRAHVAQVGDSRAYLLRRAQMRQVTKDQSYVAVLVESGVMTREQAEASLFRNSILQAMGTRPEVQVALGRIELRRGDTFLLCSDGLWSEVRDDEMFRIVRESAGPAEACARLVALANERGGRDNISVVIGEVFGDSLAEPRETVTKTYESIDPSELEGL